MPTSGVVLLVLAIAPTVLSSAVPAVEMAGVRTQAQAAAPQDAQARAAQAKAEQARAAAELAFVKAATAAIAHGKRSEAEALARGRAAGDQAAAAISGRMAIDRGEYDAARALLQSAAARSPLGDAALELGLLYRTLGRAGEAADVLMPLINATRRGVTAEGLFRAARAAHALGQARTANTLYRDASDAIRNDPAVNTAWGWLFFEKHQPGEAVKSFRVAIQADAGWGPAYAGLARALADDDPAASTAAAARALAIDPALVEAHLFVAETALDEDRPAEAKAAIDRVLAINPRSPEARSLLAAMAWVGGRSAEYEAETARALGVNPTRGDTYRTVAAHAARKYRFDEAVALGRKAAALEPANMPAHADLGMNLLRLGDEAEARRVLEVAFRGDPYDLVTLNLLRVLDTLDGFDTQKSGAAAIRMHPDEAPVLGLYAGPLAARALAEMRGRYGIDPKGAVTVQIFPKHDDFAVRTAGLPGMEGALGASFGSVVTQNSPRARKPGDFNWQATMWHELAHVFTLQLSNQRVPRWITEGISMYEEGLVDPSWPRDGEVAFARAYGEGRLPKLADLNAGFARADQIGLAYFESSVVVAIIVERHGQDALRVLVRAFADGTDVETALRKATGGGLADLQAALDARLEQRYGAMGRALRAPEGLAMPRGESAAEWQGLAARYRDSYSVQMAAGDALAGGGARDAAMAAYERAASLVPIAIGPNSPRARIAELAARGGDFRRALRELSSLVAADHANVEAARQLAQIATRLGDPTAAALAYERIVVIDPFDSAAHTALGRVATERGDAAVAVREFRAALAAGPVDPAPARCDLSEALLLAGQKAEAKRAVLAALEIAPTYARAQELLLKIVDGKH